MKIAIVGGICCGKSTVLEYLQAKQHDVFSCDACLKKIKLSEASHNLIYQLETEDLGIVYQHDPRPYAELYMNLILYANPGVSIKYNNWANNEVLKRLLASDATFYEVPIMFEIDYGLFDQVWVVKCSPESQYQRLVQRYQGDETHAKATIFSHMPYQNCLTKVDVWLDTDQPKNVVQNLIDHELGKLALLSK